MISRPNLPVVLLLSAALCFSLKSWGKADPPAVGAMKSVSNRTPKPTQKPLTSTPASATSAGSANSSSGQTAGGTTAPGSSAAGAKPGAASTSAASAVVSKTPSPNGAAQTPATPVPTDPDTVLRMSRERLTGNREKQSATDVTSIRARLVERVSISGRKFRLEGTYLQGTDLRLRLDLKVIPENSQSRVAGGLLEVCNGTILWANYTVGKETRITRRDVSQILNASKTNGEINFSTVELGLGGLPALMASLDRWMKFDSVKQEEISGKKFLVLSGKWKDSCLKDLLSKMSKQHLPEHVPDSVRIYLDPDWLLPRRIAFLKTKGTQIEPLVELDLLEPVINAPIDEHQFDFSPPDGARPVDVTAEYIKQLQTAAP
jgi:hypothetical protein